MPKAEEQIRTCRFDALFTMDRCAEALARYRGRAFLMLTFWGIFFIAEGLLFAEKSIGNLTENGFWAYTFIIIGLMLLLKGSVVMLTRPGK